MARANAGRHERMEGAHKRMQERKNARTHERTNAHLGLRTYSKGLAYFRQVIVSHVYNLATIHIHQRLHCFRLHCPEFWMQSTPKKLWRKSLCEIVNC